MLPRYDERLIFGVKVLQIARRYFSVANRRWYAPLKTPVFFMLFSLKRKKINFYNQLSL